MANKTVTVKSSGGDYTSLSAAIAGEVAANANLTAAGMDGILTIECYAMEDTTAVTVNGFTTDATHYVCIKTPASARHAGVWSTSVYRLKAAGPVITLQDDFIELDGLQIEITGTNFSHAVYGINQGPKIHHCLIRRSGGLAVNGIYLNIFQAANTEVYRNIIYDMDDGSNACYGINGGGANVWGKFYNNTIYNAATGFNFANFGNHASVIVKNNHSFGNRTNDFAWAGTTVVSANNLSEDATADDGGGSGHQVNVATTEFQDTGADDYHLALTATALDNGTDLGSPYDVDIDGTTVVGSWDIGADEYPFQYARPNADVADGNWLNQADSNTNLYASIDEATASDTDYIKSGATPTNDTCTVGLSNVTTPASGTVRIAVRAKWL